MEQGGAGQAIYEEAFRRIPALIDGSDPEVPRSRHRSLRCGMASNLSRQGRIARKLIDPRLAHYVVPLAVAGDDDARASYAPDFNEAISRMPSFWPHVRARWDDGQRVCLVSVERKTGWFHDLCFPGYLWADTEGRSAVPGMTYHDGMSSYDIQHDRLIAAMRAIAAARNGSRPLGTGRHDVALWLKNLQKRFPVVGRFLDERGQPPSENWPRIAWRRLSKASSFYWSRRPRSA